MGKCLKEKIPNVSNFKSIMLHDFLSDFPSVFYHIYSISTLNKNYSQSVSFVLESAASFWIKTLTLETRSEVRMAIEGYSIDTYRLIDFEME